MLYTVYCSLHNLLGGIYQELEAGRSQEDNQSSLRIHGGTTQSITMERVNNYFRAKISKNNIRKRKIEFETSVFIFRDSSGSRVGFFKSANLEIFCKQNYNTQC